MSLSLLDLPPSEITDNILPLMARGGSDMALDAETRDQLIATIRRCVDERLIPAGAQVAQTDAISADVLAEMKDIGLFGLSISEVHGGNGCIAAYRDEQFYRDPRNRVKQRSCAVSLRRPAPRQWRGNSRVGYQDSAACGPCRYSTGSSSPRRRKMRCRPACRPSAASRQASV